MLFLPSGKATFSNYEPLRIRLCNGLYGSNPDDLYLPPCTSERTPFCPILILGDEATIMGTLYETVREGAPDPTFRYFVYAS